MGIWMPPIFWFIYKRRKSHQVPLITSSILSHFFMNEYTYLLSLKNYLNLNQAANMRTLYPWLEKEENKHRVLSEYQHSSHWWSTRHNLTFFKCVLFIAECRLKSHEVGCSNPPSHQPDPASYKSHSFPKPSYHPLPHRNSETWSAATQTEPKSEWQPTQWDTPLSRPSTSGQNPRPLPHQPQLL